MKLTPVLLHDNNEFISISTYVEGVSVFFRMLREISDQWDTDNSESLCGDSICVPLERYQNGITKDR